MQAKSLISRIVMVGGAAAVIISSAGVFKAEAKPAFAKKEKKDCSYCHTMKPQRGFRGMYYKAHGLSFKGFVEAKEAAKAGVKKDAMGPATKPTKKYTG